MASTRPLSEQPDQILDRSSDSKTAALIVKAFDKICRDLQDQGQPERVQKIITKHLAEIADSRERDPRGISEEVLRRLGIRRNMTGRFII